jgi:hypothetical protein
MFVNMRELIELTIKEIQEILPKPVTASNSDILSTSKYLKD